MNIFCSALVFKKPPTGKGKDKSTIECLEYFCNNYYVGSKDGLIQHVSVMSPGSGGSPMVRELGRRQMGRAGAVSQLKTVPVLNHLLVLWDGSVTALNMFSLEPVLGLKRIQNVSVFYVSEPAAQTQPVFVELFTASAKRRTVSIHKVCVDRWECVGHVALSQDPVALAVHETCLCVATSDRYLLHECLNQSTLDLFPHKLGKQNVIVSKSVKGEFLLNSPGNLGMFVMESGISQRPPIPWHEGVLDAVVQFPYVLALQSQAVHVYSMLDQQLKQTVPLQSARALLSSAEGVFVVAEREIHSLTQTPLEDQIHGLLGYERVDEALTLLDGVQSFLPEDSYKNLYRSVVCRSGWIKFYREEFADAKEHFITCDLDPREIISLYPAMPVASEDFRPQRPTVNNVKDLWKVCKEERPVFLLYLTFLRSFLMEIRGTPQGQICPQDIDTALFKLYLEQEDYNNLDKLVSSPNHCALHVCVPELQDHNRFFTIGLLYQSQGQHLSAIQTWVQMVDEKCEDSSHVLQHIVKTLCGLKQKSIIWKFIDWILQKDQEGSIAGVCIFTKRGPDEQSPFQSEEVLTILNNYPFALTLYLEFLIHELHSKDEKHHTLLAMMYATRILQPGTEDQDKSVNTEAMREKLQNLLWQSSIYNAEAVHAKIKSSALHMEKAIVLGRGGDHQKALHILVHQEQDNQAAEIYCRRTSAGQSREFTQQLFLRLLQVYLESSQHLTSAVDLLNNNAAVFNPARVLQVLPEGWSLQLVMRFLCESLRGAVHERRTKGLEKSLLKVENLRHKHARMEAAQVKVKMDRSHVCHGCRRQLAGPEFLRKPAGQIFHTHCYSADGSC